MLYSIGQHWLFLAGIEESGFASTEQEIEYFTTTSSYKQEVLQFYYVSLCRTVACCAQRTHSGFAHHFSSSVRLMQVVTLRTDVLLRSLGPMASLLQKALSPLLKDGLLQLPPEPPRATSDQMYPVHAPSYPLPIPNLSDQTHPKGMCCCNSTSLHYSPFMFSLRTYVKSNASTRFHTSCQLWHSDLITFTVTVCDDSMRPAEQQCCCF